MPGCVHLAQADLHNFNRKQFVVGHFAMGAHLTCFLVLNFRMTLVSQAAGRFKRNNPHGIADTLAQSSQRTAKLANYSHAEQPAPGTGVRVQLTFVQQFVN